MHSVFRSFATCVSYALLLGPALNAQPSGGRSQAPEHIPSIEERTAVMHKLDGYFPLYWDERTGNLWLEIPRLDNDFLLATGLAALNNIDALRRAFLPANLAGHATQSCFRIIGVVNQERKVAVVLGKRAALLGILHGDEPIFFEITSDEVTRRHRHALQYSGADHRSTSPSTISTLPRMTMTSATVCPRQRSSSTVRLIKLGGRTRYRYGFVPPSLIK